MNEVLAGLQKFTADHQGVLTLLGVAAVVNLPKPKDEHSLYGWIYGTLQSFMSAIKPHVPEQQAHIVTSQQTAEASTQTDATFPVNTTNPPSAPKE
jgi:hypothetical protein